MAEGLGGLAYEGIENAVEHTPALKAAGEHILSAINHVFSLDSKLTGEGGTVIKDMKGLYTSEADKNLQIESNKYIVHPTQKALIDKKTGQIAMHSSGRQLTPEDIKATAHAKASADVFGSKHQNIAGALSLVQKEHGAFGPSKVKELTDHLGIWLHDEAYTIGSSGKQSELANNLSKYKILSGVKFEPSEYKSPGAVEKVIKKGGSNAFAFGAGIAHSTQGFVNSMSLVHAQSMTQAMSHIFGQGYAASKAELIAGNAMGNESFRELADMYNFRGGVLDKYLPGSMGEFVYKNWAIPGMSAARNFGMVMSGMSGKYEAMNAAHWLMSGGRYEKMGSVALSKMGLDWQAIKAANGVLSKEQIEQAMRYVIKDAMFTDRESVRSKWGASTPLGRVATIFHQYPIKQGNLVLQSTIERALGVKHDPMLALQQIAALAVVMPTVGNALWAIKDAVSGRRSFKDAGHDFGSREKAMYSAKFFSEDMAAISHVAGFGMTAGIINAASRGRIANYMVGAPLSATFEAGDDTLKPIFTGAATDGKHPHAFDPLKRDLLHDVPTIGMGTYVANKLYPTRTQRDAARPMTPARVRAQAAAKRRKLKPAR